MDAKAMIPWVTYAGLAVAMVGGARWPHPQWPVVLAGVAVLVAAGVWKRRADSASGGEEAGAVKGSMGAALDAARALPEAVRALAGDAYRTPEKQGAALAEAIEALLRERVEVIAAAQDDVVRRRGFEDWAALMGPTATAERLLYRAWSAASDSHRAEAERSLADAAGYADDAAREAARIGDG